MAMGFAAASTSRLRVLSLVAQNELHHPALLAKDIATIDALSDGQVELGIGPGWLADDYTALGLTLEPGRIRVARLAEALEVILKGLTHQILDHEGEFFRMKSVPIELAPLQKPHPPLWIGGHSVDGAARAARLGANYVTQDTAEATRPQLASRIAATSDPRIGPSMRRLRH